MIRCAQHMSRCLSIKMYFAVYFWMASNAKSLKNVEDEGKKYKWQLENYTRQPFCKWFALVCLCKWCRVESKMNQQNIKKKQKYLQTVTNGVHVYVKVEKNNNKNICDKLKTKKYYNKIYSSPKTHRMSERQIGFSRFCHLQKINKIFARMLIKQFCFIWKKKSEKWQKGETCINRFKCFDYLDIENHNNYR